MKTDDEKLRGDLRTAYGSDLPGERFSDRVLGEIERPGTRVREIAVPEPASRRPLIWLGIGIAAAVALFVALLGSEIVSGPGPEDDESRLATPPEEIDLPESEFAQRRENVARAVIDLTADGAIRLDGRPVSLDDLEQALAVEARKYATNRPGRPSDLGILIRTDRHVGWRKIQWIMQACASPEVRIVRIGFAATRNAEELEIPVPLPHDRELDLNPPRPRLPVRLRREKSDPSTRIECALEDLGTGEEAWTKLAALIEEHRTRLPDEPTLDATPTVPYEDVVRAIDLLLLAGYRNIRFVGTPPPARAKVERRENAIKVGLLRLRRRVRIVFPRHSAFALDEASLARVLEGIEAIRIPGVGRLVILEVQGDIPPADVRRVREALETTGYEIEVIHEK